MIHLSIFDYPEIFKSNSASFVNFECSFDSKSESTDLIISSESFYQSYPKKEYRKHLIVSDNYELYGSDIHVFEVISRWDWHEIAYRLRNLIRKPLIKTHDLIIYLDGSQMQLNDHIILLKSDWARLFCYLISNPNRIISTEELKLLINAPAQKTSRLLSVYVSQMRKTLEKLGIFSVKIIACSGRGYELSYCE